MRRILITLMGILLLPGVASATHFLEPNLTADCIGYESDFDVQFRPDLYSVNFDLVVTITNDQGEELFRYEMSDVLIRDGGPIQHYEMSAYWNDVTEEIIPLYGVMEIRGTMALSYPDSPYSTKVYFKDTLECAVVPNDELSWSSLKTNYR